MAQITVKLHVLERDALFRLAENEYRKPTDQAALFIRQGLEQAGVIATGQRPTMPGAGGERETSIN